MNHEQRRELKRRAIAKLKFSKAFFLLTSDGKGMPIHFFDLTQLGQDETDIRVIAMQSAVGAALGAVNSADEALKKRIEEMEKIAAAKKALVEPV